MMMMLVYRLSCRHAMRDSPTVMQDSACHPCKFDEMKIRINYFAILKNLVNHLVDQRHLCIRESVDINFCFTLNSFIIWLCLTRTGNYKIHEFDWLKSILTAV